MPVQSVAGKIDRRELGITAPHEHVMLDLSGFFRPRPVRGIKDPGTERVKMENLGILNRDPYALRDNFLLDDPALQAEELIRFREAGGRTVVDATMPGIGRDPLLLREISSRTGLNIVAGTGYYVGATHPDYLADMAPESIAELMIKEIEEGIDDTGIRAGFIGEIGISEEFDQRERRVLRAAAIAQTSTGVAMHIHINPWTVDGAEAAEIVFGEGVAPSRVNICHVDVENREEYIKKLLGMGVYVEFDNFGKEYYVRREARAPGYGLFASDIDRVRLIKRLIGMGHIKQLLLSCDVCLKGLLRAYGGWGYDHVLTNIVPMLEEEGISAEQVNQLLVENPADFFDVN